MNSNLVRRVVVVYDFGSINGGAAQVAIAGACGVARAGLQVDYFCAVGPVSDELTAAGATTHCLEQIELAKDPHQLAASVRGIWNTRATKVFDTLLESCDPRSTIVHFHGWTKALSASVLRTAHMRGFATVTTLHEYFTACPNGGFYDYQRHEICTRKALGAACLATHCDTRAFAHKTWRVARQAVSMGFGGVPGWMRDVIYISNFSRRILQPYFPDNTTWHFVRNPVRAVHQERADAASSNTFLFVGRLSPEKGASLFAEAATAAGVDAAIAGDGDLRDNIANQWPQVKLLGWLPGDKVGDAIRQARALVFPSLWYETQGLVVQEALAHGVPVVVADGTAARDAVQHGQNGLLFRQGDAGALATALREMGENRLVDTMSSFAYKEYWTSPPDLAAHCADLQAAYARVLEGHLQRCGGNP